MCWKLERYITAVLATNDQITVRFNVPWAVVKAHLRNSFLNVDESSALCDGVKKTRESAYEPEASFSRRFREVADAAYPGEGRNEDPRFCQGAAQRRTRKKAGGRGQPYHAGRGLHHPGWLQCQEGRKHAAESA